MALIFVDITSHRFCGSHARVVEYFGALVPEAGGAARHAGNSQPDGRPQCRATRPRRDGPGATFAAEKGENPVIRSSRLVELALAPVERLAPLQELVGKAEPRLAVAPRPAKT